MPVPLTPAGLTHIRTHLDDARWFKAAATDFRIFLDRWWFLDQETGLWRILGEVLWEAQEEFVRLTTDERTHDSKTGKDWIYTLKARKLGESTAECAYDGWVARFRDANARVHLFSRRDDAAQELLTAVRSGLQRLPEFARLPISTDNDHEFELAAGPNDRRLVKAYPADKDTAVEASCTHGHVDEWARMGDPRRVWQAIEPSMAGSCHILTTGLGPTNYTSDYWRRSLAGDTRHHPCFIGALSRPDRDAAWLRAQRRSMHEEEFNREYPLKWEDAISGGGGFVFKSTDVDMAGVDFLGLSAATRDRRYVKAWDIGRHQDAAVGICLDITDDVHDVVAYTRLRETKYPLIQRAIEEMHAAYPGLTGVEKNSAGEAVLENLVIPEHELEGWNTSGPSKARIIKKLELALQNQLLKWDPETCHQLDSEMRGYQIPDANVVQDSVMTLAIAEELSETAIMRGRVLGVVNV